MSLTTHRPKRNVWFISLCAVVFIRLCSFAPLQAADTAAISQGFKTNAKDLATGALVSLQSDNQSTIELAHTERVNQLIGVVGDTPLVELSNNDKEIQVVISGTAQALVSDINGDIKSGDKITASPISGIGMKATSSGLVVGTAQADFSTVQRTDQIVNDKKGEPKTVKAGRLPLQVNVTYYAAPEDKYSFLPPFLQALANAVAGKDVSPVRVLVSTLVLLFGFVSIAVLLYSSTRSSIISIG